MLGTYGRSRNIEGIRSVRGHVNEWGVSPRGSDDRRASATHHRGPLNAPRLFVRYRTAMPVPAVRPQPYLTAWRLGSDQPRRTNKAPINTTALK
jgi:hypothetical protein